MFSSHNQSFDPDVTEIDNPFENSAAEKKNITIYLSSQPIYDEEARCLSVKTLLHASWSGTRPSHLLEGKVFGCLTAIRAMNNSKVNLTRQQAQHRLEHIPWSQEFRATILQYQGHPDFDRLGSIVNANVPALIAFSQEQLADLGVLVADTTDTRDTFRATIRDMQEFVIIDANRALLTCAEGIVSTYGFGCKKLTQQEFCNRKELDEKDGRVLVNTQTEASGVQSDLGSVLLSMQGSR